MAGSKVNLAVYVSFAILLIAGFVIGCSDPITRNDIDSTGLTTQSKSQGHISAFDYIVSEYEKRYDNSHFESTLKAMIVANGIHDYGQAVELVIANIETFSDSVLYEEIMEEACSLFNIDFDDLQIAFSQESIKLYLDHNSQYGGIDLFNYSFADWRSDYLSYFHDALSPLEVGILNGFISMVESKSSLEDISDHLKGKANTQNITEEFAEFLTVSAMRYDFFSIHFPAASSSTPAVIFGSTCPGCGGSNNFKCSLNGCKRKGEAQPYIDMLSTLPSDTIISKWVGEIQAILEGR